MNQYEVQAAVYTKLAADLAEPIYDDVPQDAAFPYVVIGDDTSIPFDTDDTTGEESTLTLHVWSRYGGRGEAKRIMSDVYDSLNRQLLTIANSETIDCIFEFGETLLESDMETRHGVMRFRLTITHL